MGSPVFGGTQRGGRHVHGSGLHCLSRYLHLGLPLASAGQACSGTSCVWRCCPCTASEAGTVTVPTLQTRQHNASVCISPQTHELLIPRDGGFWRWDSGGASAVRVEHPWVDGHIIQETPGCLFSFHHGKGTAETVTREAGAWPHSVCQELDLGLLDPRLSNKFLGLSSCLVSGIHGGSSSGLRHAPSTKGKHS